jgi:nicotinamide-nucleotide amidase
MAAGARDRLAATYGAATTGVAGPDPADGQPAGTAHIAVCGPGGTVVHTLALGGNRDQIRALTVQRCLALLLGSVREEDG